MYQNILQCIENKIYFTLSPNNHMKIWLKILSRNIRKNIHQGFITFLLIKRMFCGTRETQKTTTEANFFREKPNLLNTCMMILSYRESSFYPLIGNESNKSKRDQLYPMFPVRKYRHAIFMSGIRIASIIQNKLSI